MAVSKRGNNSKSRRIAMSSNLFTNNLCPDASNTVRKERSAKTYRRHATRRGTLNDYKLQNSTDKSRYCHNNMRERMPVPRPPSLSPALERIFNLSWKLPGDSGGVPHFKLWRLHFKHRRHLESDLFQPYGLQIPEDWKIFQAVDWTYLSNPSAPRSTSCTSTGDSGDENPFLSNLTSSSSHASSSKGLSSTNAEQGVCPQSVLETGSTTECNPEPLIDPFSIVFRKDAVLDMRTRSQWNFMATIKPAAFRWRHQTQESASRREKRGKMRFWSLDQSARNQDLWPQVAGPPFLSFNNNTDSIFNELPSVYEQSLSCLIGRRLVDLVQTEAFPAYYQYVPQWPSRISAVRRLSTVDYICRATPKATGWHEDMCPVLFAAHPCPRTVGGWWHDRQLVTSKLATVFQPMISLFILYYLDTRTTVDDPIPRWMILFGASFNESQVEIWAHSPWLLGQSKRLWEPERKGSKEEWSALSERSAIYHYRGWRGPPVQKGVLLGALNRIQGHCNYVLHKLKAWDGYERACKLLGL
ncbi:hypothetical protein M408DRAFT_29549 [Serendipita vermifera MAFF 305830]|uniref:Uncharacterized protein n=1 Tax=Serendipita vermifera MAFF 305830 TaxID=933852 RepID=A0A0C3AA12_SERVB|nr:hypothetical protein M408DRAFT_29549 [Serendipita vermifera MAFF 305830]